MNPFFIIFISTAIRYGQFPRLDRFKYSKEYDKYIYDGRELTVEEFDVAAKRVFDPSFRHEGFSFCPQSVSAEVAAAAQESRAKTLEIEAAQVAMRQAEEDALKPVEATPENAPEAVEAAEETPEETPESVESEIESTEEPEPSEEPVQSPVAEPKAPKTTKAPKAAKAPK